MSVRSEGETSLARPTKAKAELGGNNQVKAWLFFARTFDFFICFFDIIKYMYYVYVLISLKDCKLYIGYTGDLNKRISEHFLGRSAATRNRRPLKLIYYEVYLTECEAKGREKFLKGGNGRAQLKRQLASTLKLFRYKYR